MTNIPILAMPVIVLAAVLLTFVPVYFLATSRRNSKPRIAGSSPADIIDAPSLKPAAFSNQPAVERTKA